MIPSTANPIQIIPTNECKYSIGIKKRTKISPVATVRTTLLIFHFRFQVIYNKGITIANSIIEPIVITLAFSERILIPNVV